MSRVAACVDYGVRGDLPTHSIDGVGVVRLSEVWVGSDHREVQAAAGRLQSVFSRKMPSTADDSP